MLVIDSTRLIRLSDTPCSEGVWDTANERDTDKRARIEHCNLGPANVAPFPAWWIVGPPTSLLSVYLAKMEPGDVPGNAIYPGQFRVKVAQGTDSAMTLVPGASCKYLPTNVADEPFGLLLQVSGQWGTSWRIDLGNEAQAKSAKIWFRFVLSRVTTAVSAAAVYINPALAQP